MSNIPRTPFTDFEHDRVSQAHRELGRTVVSRNVARILLSFFMIALTLPHIVQLAVEPTLYSSATGPPQIIHDTADNMSWFGQLRASNRSLLQWINTFENTVVNESAIGKNVRPLVQRAMTRWLAIGNAQVEIGSSGELFYRPDIDHVTGRGFLSSLHLGQRELSGSTVELTPYPDPRPALISFRDALAKRDITLIVMPTPVKPSVDLDHIVEPVNGRPLVANRSYRRFVNDLKRNETHVFDVHEILSKMKSESNNALYLKTDTHWRPEAVTRVAVELAQFIEALTDLSRPDFETRFRVTPTNITNQGDTLSLLGLGPGISLFPPEMVSIDRVATTENRAWEADNNAEVLLLGDSFTNIYSLAALGWGDSAGLAEQLSVALGRPVDRLSQNDDGAGAPRRLLATAIARNASRLEHTRVVIYQFANRELSQGNWHPVNFPEPTDQPTLALVALWSPSPDDVAIVNGTVVSMGNVPHPNTVPYRDHIVALHLTDLEVLSGATPGERVEALVYARSMIDNELTEVATYRPGDVVRFRLEPWSSVSGALDGITRGELDDANLISAIPWWGVPNPTAQ